MKTHVTLFSLFLFATVADASSHREALAVLGDPCSDFQDVYAWVSPGTHDKLYLLATVGGGMLHEPGQGNQGMRLCGAGYRYEFHIGIGASLQDKWVYEVVGRQTIAGDNTPSPTDPLGGGNELLWQISGGTETYDVYRWNASFGGLRAKIGSDLQTAPNFHGPQTDRLVNGLCPPYQGYDSGNATSRTVDCYNDAFAATFVHNLTNGGRAFVGQRDDPYYLDEKGVFDLVNLCASGLFGIAGARTTDCEDVFTGFNTNLIALEIPMSEIFPLGIPHNGVFDPNSTDSLLRIWASVSRKQTSTVDPNAPLGYTYSGPYVQTGRHGNPLFNAALVGAARHTKFLRSTPMTDVSNFGADILYPVLVRDAEALGIYTALGIPPATVQALKGPRTDIIDAINLGRPIPVQDGFTGDVLTLDAAIGNDVAGLLTGGYPNGRRLIGGAAADQENRDVSDLLISLVVAGNPTAGAGDGVNSNDKDYLPVFPFAPLPHSGLNGGHGGTNLP